MIKPLLTGAVICAPVLLTSCEMLGGLFSSEGVSVIAAEVPSLFSGVARIAAGDLSGVVEAGVALSAIWLGLKETKKAADVVKAKVVNPAAPAAPAAK